MTENHGYIALHRKLLDWEWYDHLPTKVLFIHLLLVANHKPKKWHGYDIERGQVLTGINALSKAAGLSVQQTRTALNKLKSTNEITIKSGNKNSIISITNYDIFQKNDSASTNKLTNKQQTTNKQLTTTNNDNKDNKIYSADFESFWSAYPNKKDKKKAAIVFKKLNTPLQTILSGLEKYKKNKEEWKQWKMAATWLNGECWNDEYETKGKSKWKTL